MMLAWLLFFPLIAGISAWSAERLGATVPRWLALIALIFEALALLLWLTDAGPFQDSPWLAELVWPWIPRFGIRFHLAIDGLSLVLILLTLAMGIAAVVSSWNEIQTRSGFFYFNLLWTIAGVIGVFLALDLFLFFVMWEVMLVPMYFIIAVWGHENRVFAATKFFIFTQGSGLLMLVAILALVMVHQQASGIYTFGYTDLLATEMGGALEFWLMLGFFTAFAVKLPAVPFHTWLADAHTQAPTGGSVLLADILLKTGAYGLIRFVVPLFPQAASDFSTFAMTLGVVGILYGALLAFAQTDFKRLVAYTSVSHMGFVLLGVFTWNRLALQGVVMQMIAHGFSTGALFMIAGAIQQRLHTRDMGRMGGLWQNMPRLGAIALFFAIAALGLPGLANFVAEFLILLGAFQQNVLLAIFAALGFIAAAVYALVLVQKTFHGETQISTPLSDLDSRDTTIMAVMILALVWLGLHPQPVFDILTPVFDTLQDIRLTPGTAS